MGHPVESAAVHDGTAQNRSVAVHVLGSGMGHDVRAPLERAAVDRGREGVVHDERHPMRVCGVCKLFNVQHGQGRVGDGLAKDDFGVGLESGVSSSSLHSGSTKVAVMPIFFMVTEMRLKVPP